MGYSGNPSKSPPSNDTLSTHLNNSALSRPASGPPPFHIPGHQLPVAQSGNQLYSPVMHGSFVAQPPFGIPGPSSFGSNQWGASQMSMMGPQGTTQQYQYSGVSESISTQTAVEIATLQAKLNRQLGPEYISTRPGPGGGPKLTYAEGWKIINLANEVFGFNGWSSSIVSLSVDFIDQNDKNPECPRFSVGVTAIVRVTLKDGVYHEDVGYGLTENIKSKGTAIDKSKKEAVTDAIKRTLRNFGNVLGNCLYDKTYTQEVVKIKVAPLKFDRAALHRRPEYQETHQHQPTASTSNSAVSMPPPTTIPSHARPLPSENQPPRRSPTSAATHNTDAAAGPSHSGSPAATSSKQAQPARKQPLQPPSVTLRSPPAQSDAKSTRSNRIAVSILAAVAESSRGLQTSDLSDTTDTSSMGDVSLLSDTSLLLDATTANTSVTSDHPLASVGAYAKDTQVEEDDMFDEEMDLSDYLDGNMPILEEDGPIEYEIERERSAEPEHHWAPRGHHARLHQDGSGGESRTSLTTSSRPHQKENAVLPQPQAAQHLTRPIQAGIPLQPHSMNRAALPSGSTAPKRHGGFNLPGQASVGMKRTGMGEMEGGGDSKRVRR